MMTSPTRPGPGTQELEQELSESCRRWQKRLRLMDWRIRVVVASAHHFEEREDGTVHLGEVSRNMNKRVALIRILDPAEAPAGIWRELDPDDYDVEVVLVHELLHIAFTGFERGFTSGSSEEEATEQAIHAISEALVRAQRQAVDV